MPSYTQYKRQVVFDDDNDIESWITVRGNHIPIKKGQSKEEAVKEFVKSKFENKEWNLENTKTGEKYYANKKTGYFEKEKYDPEFEVVRKNALANGNVYGGKYTQKSKAEAYKAYKNDTSSKEEKKDYTIAHKDNFGNTTVIAEVSHHDISEPEGKKESKSDSPMVNAVAKALNKPVDEAEKEINGAVQYIKDLIKAKDLRNGDVEETLRGLGIESDYAEEFMQWVSHPSRKKKAPKVNYVDKKAWNSPASDPWKSLYDSADSKNKWSGRWKK